MIRLLFLLIALALVGLGWVVWTGAPKFVYAEPVKPRPAAATPTPTPQMATMPPTLPKVLTVDGVTYRGVQYSRHDASSVSIIHSEGLARIQLSRLPQELQAAFGYNPQAAEKAEADRKALAQQYEQRLVDQRSKASIRANEMEGTDITTDLRSGPEDLPTPPVPTAPSAPTGSSDVLKFLASGKLASISIFGFATVGMAFGLFWGLIGAFIGSFKNRKTLGLFLGMVLGIVGLIPLIFAKDGTRDEGMTDMFMALILSAVVNLAVASVVWFTIAQPVIDKIVEEEERAQAAHLQRMAERY